MKITRGEARQLDLLLHHWQASELLDADQAQRLRGAVEVIWFDWRRLARYLLWMAMACVVIGIAALIASTLFAPLLALYKALPFYARGVLLGSVAASLFGLGWQRRQRRPERVYSNEVPNFFAVLILAGALYNLVAPWATGDLMGAVIFCLCTSLIYLGLAVPLQSGLIWLFGLLTLAAALGAETGYMSGYGAYFLGMPTPLLFVALGLGLVGITPRLDRQARLRRFSHLTRVMGLLYLFIALWILSIFGDMRGYHDWHNATHLELAAWSLLFAAAAGAAIWHGTRYDSLLTRGFGLTFLFLNLYTRFFEYFWNNLNKGVFFTLLGLSLWFLGSRAEKIWLHDDKKTNGNPPQ
jgi:hypothetical protein